MKSEKILDAIGMVGDDLVAEAKKKKPLRFRWKALVAAAACVVLIVTSVILFYPRNTVNESPNRICFSYQISTSDSPENAYIGSAKIYSSNLADPREVKFFATVRPMEILPDTYILYDDIYSARLRLVRMKTLNTIIGDDLPDEFYYAIKEEALVDFTQYDTLVLEQLKQIACEDSVLYNCTEESPEVIDKTIFWFGSIHPAATIIAFTDDVFDESLWTINDLWSEETESSREYLHDDTAELYNVRSGWTLQQVEEATAQVYVFFEGASVSTRAAVTSEEGIQAMDYIRPFENGIFAMDSSNISTMIYRRYLGGFPTNETVALMYGDCGVVYWGETFTQADADRLPDLYSAIAAIQTAMDANQINPPHIENFAEMKRTTYGINGWYFKADGKIYGAIRINFCFVDKDLHYDDIYYIVEYGSDYCGQTDRDHLLELQGTNDFIYTGEYNKNGRWTPYLV